MLTESWLNADILDSELGFNDYNVFRTDRSVSTSSYLRGGGVIICVHKKYSSKQVFTPITSVEQLFVLVEAGDNNKFLLGTCYIPPVSPFSTYVAHTEAIDYLCSLFVDTQIILSGDYNLPNVKFSNDDLGMVYLGNYSQNSDIIFEQFSHLNFYQVNEVGNDSGKILDLIFVSNNSTRVKKSEDNLVPVDSFHPALYISSDINIRPKLDNLHSDDINEIANMFGQFFGSVYSNSSKTTNGSFSNISECVDIKNCYLSITEVFEGLSSLHMNLTVGPDLVPEIFLKNCCYSLTRPIHFLLSLSLSSGIFPTIWKTSYVYPIFKSGIRSNIRNYRPITKMSTIPKLFEKLLVSKLYYTFSPILVNNQHGFRTSKSTVTNLLVYYSDLMSIISKGGQVDAIYTDLKKAFDSVNHSILISKLSAMGVGNPMIDWLSSYLSGRKQIVKIGNVTSFTINAISGVPQDLNKFVLWCFENGLQLNSDKCSQITFSRVKSVYNNQYVINGFDLSRVNHIKDLGVFLSWNLSFSKHISYIYNKALRTLGFIRRNCNEFHDVECLKTLYFSLVRSGLEYGSIIWSPFVASEIKKIESVQNRFLTCLSYKLNKNRINYENFRDSLKMDSLLFRRQYLDIKWIYNLLNNKIDCPEILDKLPFNVPQLSLRNHSMFYIPTLAQNYSRNSPVNRMLYLCNSLNNFDFNHDSSAILWLTCRNNLNV
ncbi:uncharacterized protein LOC126902005 [Daktulosphaira vitifoliae]|uniref:uncharacterized protein LOC126902005 n=1 Tax=Daktulosphaira vitifoliae TaxID=58002 RepID=UPI0021AAB3A4|nr:uncharacterized protein LOC126902005 [Daktulosphaira vitifoliae]